ncbi:MAG: threonine synthase [Candidatus Limiplasma sp.]|nr:threonine synthase [Candidatus Limiplasma sp.]
MHATGLRCAECAWRGPLELTYICPKCGGSLEVTYDYTAVDVASVTAAVKAHRSVWSFKELLPVRAEEYIVTMDEGGTPLRQSRAIANELGVSLFYKDETRNPTLSFKDRPNTVGISVAREMGYDTIAIASTGNGAASLSAYAAHCDMACNVFIPVNTPSGKLVQTLYHGANVIRVPGNYSASFRVAHERCGKEDWANLTSTYINPYTMEGDKTIGYEIFGALEENTPDWIVVPLGAGPMLSGIYKSFEELRTLGLCDKLPRMLGVQAEGCAPIIDAFLRGDDAVRPWLYTETVADAIADPLTGYERDGSRTARAIRRSGGYGVKLSDKKILNYVNKLARQEGIFTEPASAASVAAVADAMEQGVIRRGESVVSIITAHGLKAAEELLKLSEAQA